MQEGPYLTTVAYSENKAIETTQAQTLHIPTITKEFDLRKRSNQSIEDCANTFETHVSSKASVSSSSSSEQQTRKNTSHQGLNDDESKHLEFQEEFETIKSNKLIVQPEYLRTLQIRERLTKESLLRIEAQDSLINSLPLLGKRLIRDGVQNQEQEICRQSNEIVSITNESRAAQLVQNYITNQAASISFGAQTQAPFMNHSISIPSFQKPLPMPLIKTSFSVPQNTAAIVTQGHILNETISLPQLSSAQQMAGNKMMIPPFANFSLSAPLTNNNSNIEPTIQDLKKQIFNRRLINSQIEMNQRQTIGQQQQQLLTQNYQNCGHTQFNAQLSQQFENHTTAAQQQSPLMQLMSKIKVDELKTDIFAALPNALAQDTQFVDQLQRCPLNRMLLDYFVHSEISKKISDNQPQNITDTSVPQNLTCKLLPMNNQQACTSINHESQPLLKEIHADSCKNSLGEENDDHSSDVSFEDQEGNGDENPDSKQQSNKVMPITKCPHPNRKHYAKNMCSSCYRKYGRSQYASKCQHSDRLLYSMGMCQTCYLADYHKRRCKPLSSHVSSAKGAEDDGLKNTTNQTN